MYLTIEGVTRALAAPRGCVDVANTVCVQTVMVSSQCQTAGSPKYILNVLPHIRGKVT